MTISQVNDPFTPPPFGPTLRHWRESNGLSQAALARQIGVTHGAVNRWEFGDARPRTKHFAQLRRIMDEETIAPFLRDYRIVAPDPRFGPLLKVLRVRYNVTIPALAKRLKVTPSIIHRWETTNHNARRHPSYRQLVTVCCCLRLTAEDRAQLMAAAGFQDSGWGQPHA